MSHIVMLSVITLSAVMLSVIARPDFCSTLKWTISPQTLQVKKPKTFTILGYLAWRSAKEMIQKLNKIVVMNICLIRNCSLYSVSQIKINIDEIFMTTLLLDFLNKFFSGSSSKTAKNCGGGVKQHIRSP
jgi:hypothetical protein